MSYAKGKNFNVVFLPLRYSAGDTYRGSGLVSCNLCIITSLCKPNLPITVLHFGLTEKLELNRFFNIKFFSTGGGGGGGFPGGGDDFLGNSPPPGGEDFQGGRISFYTGYRGFETKRNPVFCMPYNVQ